MKLLSTLMLLYVFSSYHLAESKPGTDAEHDKLFKATLKNLANGSEKVTNTITTILEMILFGNDDAKSAQAADEVLKDAPEIKSQKDNGETGTGTLAYIDALASALKRASEEARKHTNDKAEKSEYSNGALVEINTLVTGVSNANNAANVALSTKVIGSKQSAVTALNTLASGLVSAAEVAIGAAGVFDVEPEKYGQRTDEVPIGKALNDLSVAVKGAADATRKALAV